MEMTDRYQEGRWYLGVQCLDLSVRAQPDPESDRQDSTHENSHSTFREELNADVSQTNTTRGRADGDLLNDAFEQRMYADRRLHRGHVGVDALLEDASCRSSTSSCQPVDGRQAARR